MKVHKRYALAEHVSSMEALGQLRGSDRLEDDIALCRVQTIEKFFLRHLPKGERILEAGAGRGRWVFHLRRQGYDVVGIDIAKTDIEFGKKYDSSTCLMVENVLGTSFPDHHFGAIISLGVVEHFEDGPQRAFTEVMRLLRPGGLFLVTVPTQNLGRWLLFNRVKDVQLLMRRLRGSEIAFEEYRYSRRQFGDLLVQAGFEIVETAPDDFFPPKNMGLYTDSRFLQHRTLPWELNRLGKAIDTVQRLISPWLNCSGTLWVCRKPSQAPSA